MKNDKEFAEYISKNCIHRVKDGYMFGKLAGTRYSSQYYMARGLYNRDFLEYVSLRFYEIVKKEIGHFNFQITGREWAAFPLIIGLPIFLKKNHNIDINSFMIKRERKAYGLHNYIEGVPNELPVLIVDDLCNSTGGFRFCKNVLVDTENMEVLPFIFAVVNKESKNGREDGLTTDKYLSKEFRALYILCGDDISNAVMRRNTTN